ncbi:MAG: dihydropyrimidinase [Lachnospiraceae bacterium]|nr:dihydropyrimidinase [Lachnospiraceae bacterium]
MKTLLKNGFVVSGRGTRKQDILIEDEKITAMGSLTEAADEVVDLGGKYLFPGFIDGHTHFDLEVSGTVTADDFATGTRAALAGGTTVIIDFATQNKGETLKEAFANWEGKAAKGCSCDYGFHMAISDWNEGVKQEIQDMIDRGITSFKLYMTYPAMRLNDGELYEVIKELKEHGCFAGVHCENADLIDAHIRERQAAGKFEPENHPKVRPDTLEAEAVHRLMVIAGEAKAPVMVVHITGKKALEEIKRAREAGQTVYAETCPHYLLLDETVFEKPNFEAAKYICSPPMRAKENQDYLWKAIAAGDIDTIATDHCSFTMEQKRMGLQDFSKIPNGMPGVENRGPLMFSYGVQDGRITAEKMCQLLAENPAKLYGLYPKKGVLAPGSDADIVVFDPEKASVISAATQHYHMDYSPYEGFELKGSIAQVYLRGRLAVMDGEILLENAGQYQKRGLPEFGE